MTHRATPRILSLNVGHAVPQPYTSAPGTAIDKRPVPRIEVRAPGPKKGGLGSGVVGDQIGDPRHHGGDNQAVYAYAREDLDWWEKQLGRDLPDGMFGENLTVGGIDCTNALVGERWSVGDAVLEVRGPRIPCRTFAGHMGERGWVKRFAAEGRTGAYLGVVTPGSLGVGDEVTVTRPDHDVTLLHFFRAVMGDRAQAQRVLASGALNAESERELSRFLR